MIQKRIYNYFERNPQLRVLFILDELGGFEVTVFRNNSSQTDKTEGTSQYTSQGTSRGTSQDADYYINQDISMSIQQDVPSQGVPSQGTSRGVLRRDGGLEIVTKGILRFCNEPKTLKEIAEYLGVKAYKKIKARYLDVLISESKLVMAIPDKPTSRFQKYVATGKTSNKKSSKK